MSSENETRNILVNLVFEIIGRPPEHLIETLGNIIKNVGGEKGISVKNKNIREAVAMEKQKDMFSTFAEVEIEAENIFDLLMLMFKYMPAHVEIVYPETLQMSNNGWSEVLNELMRRLHGYDEVAKVLQIKHAQMEQKLKEYESKEKKESA